MLNKDGTQPNFTKMESGDRAQGIEDKFEGHFVYKCGVSV
jgi:hypothetical protein